MSQSATSTPVFDVPVPRLLRALGARWRDGRRAFRMKWGELSFGRSGWAIQLCLFGGDPPHYSIHLAGFWVSVYVRLPFRARPVAEDEIMESCGVSYDSGFGALHCSWWGGRYTILTMSWRDWQHMSHDVRTPDGRWVPFVGSWETGKEPDGRAVEVYPYRYLLRSGEKQERTATIHAERRIWRLRWLRWTRRFEKVRHSIDIEFNEEVGERTGSWKGGVLGCGYDLKPNETPRECLRRMEQERRFA